jgi:hypothetical protein
MGENSPKLVTLITWVGSMHLQFLKKREKFLEEVFKQ